MSLKQVESIRRFFKRGDSIKILFSLDSQNRGNDERGEVMNVDDNGILIVKWNEADCSKVSLMKNLVMKVA